MYVATSLCLHRRETAASDAVLPVLCLDAPPTRWPDYFDNWRLCDVREIILHVITETAPRRGTRAARRPRLARPGGHPDSARLSEPRPYLRAQEGGGMAG